MRQQAWLSTAPDKPVKGQKEEPKQLTHYQMLERKYEGMEWFEQLAATPDIPIETALWLQSFQGDSEFEEVVLPYELAHIWAHLLECGPVVQGGMGPAPLSYLEIKAWMQSTGLQLSAWEVVLLRKCSLEWMSAQYEAKDPTAVPPWSFGGDQQQTLSAMRQSLADRLKKALDPGPVKGKKK